VKHFRAVSQLAHTRVLCNVAWFLLITSGVLNAQSGKTSFVSFNDFVASTKAASTSDYSGKAGSQVKGAQAFEEMQQHILKLYEGVDVSHSFMLDGDHFDCVPEMQQPGVRLQGLTSIATPPPASALAKASRATTGSSDSAQKPIGITSQLSPDKLVDEFGHSRVCEDHTIPMRRVTLQDTTRFATLKDFFAKGPDGAGQPPRAGQAKPQTVAHKYSYTYQYINNLGDTTTINLWSPYVNTSLGEIFSLSQSWTIAYTPVEQTAEVGWQNYPGYYGNQNARLFTYWTADGYNRTGCYNLSCGAFVQYNGGNGWYIGAGFSNYSSWGGAQYEMRAEYYFYQGNWWLGLGNVNGISWVGYYPASLYGTGAMRTNAQLLEFGTEGVGSNPWPPEGSGGWAGYGFGYAAYQRELWYFANPSDAAYWDTLTADQPSSNCYSIAGPYWGGYTPPSNDWGTYFYEGGPGGYNCY
jgi:Neprosin